MEFASTYLGYKLARFHRHRQVGSYEHRLDHPRRGEYLAVVGDAPFGLDELHGSMHFGPRLLIVTVLQRR